MNHRQLLERITCGLCTLVCVFPRCRSGGIAIEPADQLDDAWHTALANATATLAKRWPGVAVEDLGGRREVVIPAEFKTGHEAHFGQVVERYLRYRQGEPVPAWEVPNTLTKYNTLMEAWRMSH